MVPSSLHYYRRPTIMSKWLCIAAVLLLAGCLETNTAVPMAGIAAGANPEPVARPTKSATARSADSHPQRHAAACASGCVDRHAPQSRGRPFPRDIDATHRGSRPDGGAGGDAVLRTRHHGPRVGPPQGQRVPRIETRRIPSEWAGISDPNHKCRPRERGAQEAQRLTDRWRHRTRCSDRGDRRRAQGRGIGAGAGAGAGTAGAAATGKRQVAIQAETPLRFTLRASVEM